LFASRKAAREVPSMTPFPMIKLGTGFGVGVGPGAAARGGVRQEARTRRTDNKKGGRARVTDFIH